MDQPLTALARRIPHLLGDTNAAFIDWLRAAQELPKKSDELAYFVIAGALGGIEGLKNIALLEQRANEAQHQRQFPPATM